MYFLRLLNIFYYIIGLLLGVSTLFLISTIVDPYGLLNNKNKRVDFLMIQDNPLIFREKIKLQSPYYLVGTSRTLSINPIIPQQYLNKTVTHLGFRSQSISQWIFLLEKIKKNHGHVILGLDAFSLNNYFDKNFNQSNSRMLYSALDSYRPYFLDKKFIEHSIVSITTNFFKNNINFFNEYDINGSKYTMQDIRYWFIERNAAPGKKYCMDEEQVRKLIHFLQEGDIVIIFPKYYLYYKLFQTYPKQYNIQKQYFKVVKQIVLNTKAQVWSFYGINSITLNKNNFDTYGWHFKSKISSLIFARIFNDKSVKIPKDFGVLLTKENIDEELKKIENQEKQYFQN